MSSSPSPILRHGPVSFQLCASCLLPVANAIWPSASPDMITIDTRPVKFVPNLRPQRVADRFLFHFPPLGCLPLSHVTSKQKISCSYQREGNCTRRNRCILKMYTSRNRCTVIIPLYMYQKSYSPLWVFYFATWILNIFL